MSATPTQSIRPPRHLFAVAVLAALISVVITLSFAYADHAPTPHGVRIAVAAPAAAAHALQTGMNHAMPGGFRVLAQRSDRVAIALVRSQSVAGAFLVPPNGRVTIVTAGAAGAGQQQAVTAALAAAAQALHRPARVLDAVPLPVNDRAGLSTFVFELGLLIPSVLGSIGLFLLGIRFRIWWRIAAAALFSLLVGLTSFLVLDGLFGALTGAGAALIAIGTFGALSFVLTIGALQALLGMPGTGLAALLLVFVGNAVSGGTVAIAFLPDGFRQVAPWLPNAAIVRAVRAATYFSGHGIGQPLLVLSLWAGTALLLLVGVDRLHLRARRRAPESAHLIHATPGIALLRQHAA